MARIASVRHALSRGLSRNRDQVRVAFSNRAVRRVQFGLGANQVSEWAYFTALEVFAFEVGGAFAVGLVGVLSELPAAIAAPLTALLGERIRHERLLFGLAVLRSVELAAAGLAFSRGAPPELFYALLGFDSILSSAVYPNQQGLLPRLTRSRDELATSAAVTALVESVGGGIGPVLGGVLLATTNLGVVYGVAAGVMLSSGVLFLGAPRGKPAEAAEPPAQTAPGAHAGEEDEDEEDEEEGGLISDLVEGLRAISGVPDARLLLLLFAVDGLMEGALDVFVIVLALKVLGIGAGGVGGLAAVEMVGGLVGGAFAFRAVHVRGLGVRWTLMGLADAVPPLLLAAFPTLGVVIVMLLAWEALDTLDEAIGLELLRRVIPPPLIPSALGLEDSMVTLSIAIGSIVAPALVVLLGVRGGLLAIGVTAPILVLATLTGMRRIDKRTQLAT